MFKKIGGGAPPPPSIQSSRAPQSTGSTRAPAPAPAPGPSANMGSSANDDKFAAMRLNGGFTPNKVAMPTQAMPGGTNVSSNFAQNPVVFSANNVLNVNNNHNPPGVALPVPGKPFVPAQDSVVTVHAHQQSPGAKPGNNANMTFGPAGGQGAQAHYLHYLSTGEGRFAGISGVPQKPTTGPTTVVTGQLNGCAVHAFHDKNTGTMSFMHHADFSKNGKQELADFQKQHPHLQHAATVGPADYARPTGQTRQDGTPLESGATLFAQYDKKTQQWAMVGQLNEQKPNTSQQGRPDLVRPEFANLSPKPTQSLYVPIPPPQ